jgi:two-component system chemotaxis response regulator CheY
MIISDIRSAAKFKQTVLIVDDQTVALNIHKAILKSLELNLNIVTMTSPVDALNWAKKKQVDLIITDFSMKEMDGMQLLQSINYTNSANLTPIIVITVLKDKALHQQLLAAGAAACLTKPVNSQELCNVAQLLLDKSKAFYTHKITSLN